MRCNCESVYCTDHNTPTRSLAWPFTNHPATQPCKNDATGEWMMDEVGSVCEPCALTAIEHGGRQYIHHDKEAHAVVVLDVTIVDGVVQVIRVGNSTEANSLVKAIQAKFGFDRWNFVIVPLDEGSNVLKECEANS